MDLILSELVNLVTQNDSTSIKTSIFEAIHSVLLKSGDKVSVAAAGKIKDSVMDNIIAEDDALKIHAAKCLTIVVFYAEELFVTDLVLDLLETAKRYRESGQWNAVSGSLLALAYSLSTAGGKVTEFREEVYEFFKSSAEEAEQAATKGVLSK